MLGLRERHLDKATFFAALALGPLIYEYIDLLSLYLNFNKKSISGQEGKSTWQ